MQPTHEHPGEVTFVDGGTGEVVAVIPIAELPEGQRFAQTPEGPVPVVRVVATRVGEERRIEELGPKGELLRSTLQRRDPAGARGAP